MNVTIRYVILSVEIVLLSSCVSYQDNYIPSYEAYLYDNSQLYSQESYRIVNYEDNNTQSSKPVSVPNSYHVGEFHSPVSFKDRDKSWVASQNPQEYTIEVADDAKASKVAKKLHNAPKSDRMAEVKYQRGGQTYYKGVYGSYKSADEAQNALNALPVEIKQGAGIRNWGSVQNQLGE